MFSLAAGLAWHLEMKGAHPFPQPQDRPPYSGPPARPPSMLHSSTLLWGPPRSALPAQNICNFHHSSRPTWSHLAEQCRCWLL